MLTERQARRRIARWCDAAMEGHSTQAVATALEVRWNTASDWRTGEACPGGLHLVRLAAYTGYSLCELDVSER